MLQYLKLNTCVQLAFKLIHAFLFIMCLQKSLECWLHDCAKLLKSLFVSGSFFFLLAFLIYTHTLKPG